MVVVAGDSSTVDDAIAAAFVYRRRLTEARAFVVPAYTDGGTSKANALGEVESKWLWATAEPQQWRAYFEELLSERGMAMAAEGACIGLNLTPTPTPSPTSTPTPTPTPTPALTTHPDHQAWARAGAWIGLNLRGRTFGSALGAPRWDELLGTMLQPVGDGFGELEEPAARDVADAAQEAAAAAAAIGVAGAGAAAAAAAAAEAEALLTAQASFYQALNSADASAMKALWDPEVTRAAPALHPHCTCALRCALRLRAPPALHPRTGISQAPDDSYVSDVVRAGSRVEPWEAGSNAFPPSGMRATDVDALVLSPTEGWTTAVERPAEGGTLLATQVWRRADGDGAWRLTAHRYIPWSADGATAVAALRCDRRGCVLIGRQINTRAP